MTLRSDTDCRSWAGSEGAGTVEEAEARTLTPELVLVSPELRELETEITPELVLVSPELRHATVPRWRKDIAKRSAPRAARSRTTLRATASRRLWARAFRRRAAKSLAFTILFFAGAALSAGAGDQVATLVESTDAVATEPVTATSLPSTSETVTVEEPEPTVVTQTTEVSTSTLPPENASGPVPPLPPGADDPADEQEAAPPPTIEAPPNEVPPAPPAVTTEETETIPTSDRNGAKASTSRSEARRRPRGARLHAIAPPARKSEPVPPVELGPETQLPGAVLGPLPDPTPPSRRLDPLFAKFVLSTARQARTDWALLLGALRAGGEELSPKQRRLAVRSLAKRLRSASRAAHPARALAALVGGEGQAEKALTLARYHRAVGMETLVVGLRAAKRVLAARVATDPRISIYRAGVQDVTAGRVDPRILALLLYLADAHGQVTVSSLIAGHRVYARPGVVSAHVSGLAVDISALGGVPVFGNQHLGGVVERAVRGIVLLPAEVQPQQLISLFDLGGPSFSLADHADHLHVGYGPRPEAGGWSDLRDLWKRAGARFGVPWQVLGAINKIESNFGRNMGPSSAGAIGWMQFLPSTWRAYGLDANGDGIASPWNAEDAVFSAARYLEAAGARRDLPRAIFAYNHAHWYVRDVLETARTFGP
jgi:hypothetical protein